MTNSRLPGFALLSGNFVIGVSVLAPAGMLKQLADSLSLTIAQAGMLMTIGAVILCVGSPVMAWATSHIEQATPAGGFDSVAHPWPRRLDAGAEFCAASGHPRVFYGGGGGFHPHRGQHHRADRAGKGALGRHLLHLPRLVLAIAAGLPVVTFLAAHLGGAKPTGRWPRRVR